MDLDKIFSSIYVNEDTKVSPRSALTYKKLFSTLVEYDTIEQAAEALNVTTNSLEHTLSRNIRKLFPTKVVSCSWSNYLKGILGYKKCQKCKKTLELSSYSKNASTYDNTAYTCRDCKALYKESFTINNPEYAKNNYQENKSAYIARAIHYNTRRTLATPPWADIEMIKRIYDCAEESHVDHIIPLQGKLVCGLHVETNLQYLSAEENIQNSNKFIAG